MAKARLIYLRKKLLSSKHIGLDSMVFMYHFADHPRYAPITELIFQMIENGEIHAVTSIVTVSELFVLVEKQEDRMIEISYEEFLNTLPHFKIIPGDWHTARLASKLRASYTSLRLPDALQLSAPLLMKCPLFITNDKRIQKIKEIEILLIEDYV